MSDRPVTVIYHANCPDGFCAAWVLRMLYPAAEFVPANYGEPPPDVAGRRVVIADFSYKRPVMRQILSAAHSVTVLDHHKTAEAELAGIVDEFVLRPDLIANPPGSELPAVRLDMTRSGGRLAWEHVWDTAYAHRFSSVLVDQYMTGPNDRGHPPWLVRYTEDRDLWRWALPESQAVSAALRSYPFDFAEWDRLAGLDPMSLVPEGRAILRTNRQVIDRHVRNARPTAVGGYTVPAVNATVLFSEIAGELAEGQPFGACYFDRADGRRQWSLRSRAGGVDVSEVARSLGGGGHPRAAGFEEVLS